MKTLFLTIVILGCGCSKPAPKPTNDGSTVVSHIAVPAAPNALSTDEILRCDRRSVLYDQSKHLTPPEQEVPKVHARNMRPGESGYIVYLTSKGGRIYVDGGDEVKTTPDQAYTTMIRRVTDGFLADCDSPELWVWLDEGATVHADPANLVPVVGHIDVKPRRKEATTVHASGNGFVIRPGDVLTLTCGVDIACTDTTAPTLTPKDQ